jgi:hypothetical protein
MTGLQGTGNQVEPLWELLFEGPKPARPLEAEKHEREREPGRGADRQRVLRPRDHAGDQRHQHGQPDGDQEDAAQRHLESSRVDPSAEGRPPGRAGQDSIDSGQRPFIRDLHQQLGLGVLGTLDGLRDLPQPRVEPPLPQHLRQVGNGGVPAHHQADADDECQQNQRDGHYRTSVTPSNMSAAR